MEKEHKRETIRFIIIALVAILAIFVLGIQLMQGCGPKVHPKPYGVWHSEAPELTLHIDPDAKYEGGYWGEMVIDGETRTVRIIFDTIRCEMAVYDAVAVEGDGYSGEHIIFTGYYDFKGDTMEYHLLDWYAKETGYKKITFKKIGDYEIPEESSSI